MNGAPAEQTAPITGAIARASCMTWNIAQHLNIAIATVDGSNLLHRSPDTGIAVRPSIGANIS
ncbi:hypothetical protein SPHV1_160036 [Novosphingobium sp. KN65.2]|nr:hypothetical protein SPHV1_160036 [Novosphingobium sp. KN65.2]